MTSNDLDGFEHGLVTALLAMMDAKLGPAFDLADIQAVVGDDPTLIQGPFASDVSASAALATTETIQKMAQHLQGERRADGVVAQVIMGPLRRPTATVKAVLAVLRNDAGQDSSLICGACVDPTMGTQVQVVLWGR